MISIPLLPLESTDSLGNFGDGNKPKTIANRDQKIRRIPSRTMLRLTLAPTGRTSRGIDIIDLIPMRHTSRGIDIIGRLTAMQGTCRGIGIIDRLTVMRRSSRDTDFIGPRASSGSRTASHEDGR